VSACKLVAIVDDEEAILVSMSGFIRSCDYVARTFISAESFLASDAVNTARCLITDIQTPEMDGFALRARLQTLRPDIKVIMITALDDETLEERAKSVDVYAFFQKPVAVDRLAECLADIFRASPDAGASSALF